MKDFFSDIAAFISGQRPKSIRNKFITLVLALVLFFIAMTTLINSLFLKSYYTQQKKISLMHNYTLISHLDFNSAAISQRLAMLEEQQNIQILILDNNLRIFFCSSPDYRESIFIPVDESGSMWYNDWLVPSEGNQSAVGIFPSQPKFSFRYNDTISTEYLSLYGKPSISFKEATEPFYIIINTPVAAIEEGVAAANKFTMLVGLLTALLGGIVSTIFCFHLTSPILQISRTARKMAQFDFTEKVPVTSGDELGGLAVDINHLSSELEQKINELSAANEQLTKDIAEKEQIDIMRRDFISSVSHDLRTPLSIILGYCEGLQAALSPEDQEYYCSVIEEEALHMSALTKKLLDLAELESGGDTMDKSIFDLSVLAAERLEKVGYLTREREISAQCVGGEDCLILADRDRTEEIINNLLSNAINYTPDGGRIRISVAREEGDVVCRVYNSGSSIPEGSLPLIWTSFYRVDKARTRKYGGAGLGLKIVSTILEMHGGRYGVVNLDDGVEFWFSLPLAADI